MNAVGIAAVVVPVAVVAIAVAGVVAISVTVVGTLPIAVVRLVVVAVVATTVSLALAATVVVAVVAVVLTLVSWDKRVLHGLPVHVGPHLLDGCVVDRHVGVFEVFLPSPWHGCEENTTKLHFVEPRVELGCIR